MWGEGFFLINCDWNGRVCTKLRICMRKVETLHKCRVIRRNKRLPFNRSYWEFDLNPERKETKTVWDAWLPRSESYIYNSPWAAYQILFHMCKKFTCGSREKGGHILAGAPTHTTGQLFLMNKKDALWPCGPAGSWTVTNCSTERFSQTAKQLMASKKCLNGPQKPN